MTSSAEPAVRRLGPTGRSTPVPVLVDPPSEVLLRAHQETDLERLVEEARDELTVAWTNVPTPRGGYADADARRFLAASRTGWRDETTWSWAVTRADPRRYLGSVHLQLLGDRRADLSFVLHPDARGHGTMSAAVRLVVAHGFDAGGLRVVHWQAYAGHRTSWRVAESAGLRFEGTRRLAAVHRGELRDLWTASITADDPRAEASP